MTTKPSGKIGTAAASLSLLLIVAALLPARSASTEGRAAAAEPQKVLVEIYRIAPGKHEAFLRDIASYDEANRMAGLPPRQLYVHSDGAGWDFMLIQPAETPGDKAGELSGAWTELGLPSGARFFVDFRENIAEHSDTFAYGPTSARAVLNTLEE